MKHLTNLAAFAFMAAFAMPATAADTLPVKTPVAPVVPVIAAPALPDVTATATGEHGDDVKAEIKKDGATHEDVKKDEIKKDELKKEEIKK